MYVLSSVDNPASIHLCLCGRLRVCDRKKEIDKWSRRQAHRHRTHTPALHQSDRQAGRRSIMVVMILLWLGFPPPAINNQQTNASSIIDTHTHKNARSETYSGVWAAIPTQWAEGVKSPPSISGGSLMFFFQMHNLLSTWYFISVFIFLHYRWPLDWDIFVIWRVLIEDKMRNLHVGFTIRPEETGLLSPSPTKISSKMISMHIAPILLPWICVLYNVWL